MLTLAVVALLFYGNLRGIREAGSAFAFPLYFFIIMAGLVIVVGLARELTGNLHLIVLTPQQMKDAYPIKKGNGFIEGATILVLLRAFANGGASLTGFEAISNGVSAFRPPESRNSKRVLLIMACTLAFLVSGVSWIAHVTHATPFQAGYPTVLFQEGQAAFGKGVIGRLMVNVMQAATALILYTGANTSFNGFPFLANFVAEDRFLPRQLTRRGHRLVFSNAIIVLTLIASVLLIATNAKVNSLVPFYAIGVFTGFSMAGYGMAKHYSRTREGHWRRSVAINMASGIVCTIVVAIFAIAKFTEGAWLIVIVFPVMVFVLIRLNREYREESRGTRLDHARGPLVPAELLSPRRAAVRQRPRPCGDRRAAIRPDPQGDRTAGRALRPRRCGRRDGSSTTGSRPRRASRSRSWIRPTADSAGRRSSWSPGRPPCRARTSRCCCHDAASRPPSAGCCTTGRPTRSPP